MTKIKYTFEESPKLYKLLTDLGRVKQAELFIKILRMISFVARHDDTLTIYHHNDIETVEISVERTDGKACQLTIFRSGGIS